MRINIVRNLLKSKNLPAKTGAELLEVNHTSIYYQKPPASDEELECKKFIDHIHTDILHGGHVKYHHSSSNTVITLAEKRRVTICFRNGY